jgi:predicted  nucleic acid-binding Zn-ribbon protein
VKDTEKTTKELGVLKMLLETMEGQYRETCDKYKAICEEEQTKKKAMSDLMQTEIQGVQKELEEDMKRKSMLKAENEELEKRITDLKAMFKNTSESIEKTLGNSELDMAKIEEQIRQKIEVETTKLVVFAISPLFTLFRTMKRAK